MNFHGYLIIAADESSPSAQVGNGWAADLFDPWSGPLSTRFAATFVLVAGVGVTLLTRSSIGDPATVTTMRWRLVRRGVLLYVVGLAARSHLAGHDHPLLRRDVRRRGGDLHVPDPLDRARSVPIAALAGAGINAWLFWQAEDGNSTEWLTVPGHRFGTGLRVRRVRQRHPPAAAVVRLHVRRHRARPPAGARVVASGGDLDGRRALHGRHPDRVVRHVAVPAHRAVDRVECRQPRLRGERARHGAPRLRLHRLGGRTLPAGDRPAAPRRPDDAHHLPRPRVRVQPRRRLARLDRPRRPRRGARVRRRLLDRRDRSPPPPGNAASASAPPNASTAPSAADSRIDRVRAARRVPRQFRRLRSDQFGRIGAGRASPWHRRRSADRCRRGATG